MDLPNTIEEIWEQNYPLTKKICSEALEKANNLGLTPIGDMLTSTPNLSNVLSNLQGSER